MAIEAVKTTGTAYQGSSQKPAVETVNASVNAGNESAASTLNDSSNVKWQGQELSIDNGNDAAENGIYAGTEAMREAVEEINKNAKNSKAIFGFHDKTNRVTIKIVDKESKKVLKEYPPEKTLDMIAKAWELAGLMVDEKR